MARDQPRSGPRLLRGIPKRFPMTSIGMWAAKSSTISAWPRSAMRSSSRSTSATRSGSMRAIARWVSALMSKRRTRVCNGGSLKTRLVVWCS